MSSRIMNWILQEIALRHVENKTLTGDTQRVYVKGKLWVTNFESFYNRVTAFVDKRRTPDIIHPNLCKAFCIALYNIFVFKLKNW